MTQDPFSRTRLLLGDAGMARLAAARVAVFGARHWPAATIFSSNWPGYKDN